MPLVLNGATSGSTTIQATDSVTATLTLPSSTGTLLSTASPASGNVIQVVQGTTSNVTSTTSTTYVASQLTASITPKFATSKIMVLITSATTQTTTGQTSNITVYRNGSVNIATSTLGLTAYENSGGSGYSWVPASGSIIDSPATTSSTTYTVYVRAGSGGTAYVNWGALNNTITLLEIAV